MSCKKSVSIRAKLLGLFNFFAETNPHENYAKQISFKLMNREWVGRSKNKSFNESDVIFYVIMLHVHDPLVDMSTAFRGDEPSDFVEQNAFNFH